MGSEQGSAPFLSFTNSFGLHCKWIAFSYIRTNFAKGWDPRRCHPRITTNHRPKDHINMSPFPPIITTQHFASSCDPVSRFSLPSHISPSQEKYKRLHSRLSHLRPLGLAMNEVGEALEENYKIVEEARGPLVNTFLPPLQSGCQKSEREGSEED